VQVLSQNLSSRILSRIVIEAVRKHVAGTQLDKRGLYEFCWRMAGNERRMMDGRHVLPWTGQPMKEWVPAQVIRARARRGGARASKLGYEFYFQILAGTPCPQIITQWWSLRKCRYMACRKQPDGRPNGWGFSRRRGQRLNAAPVLYPYLDPRQFVTLRCDLLLEPELSDEAPGFRQFGFTSSLETYNREQQKWRARRDRQHACQEKFDPRDVPCHLCPIGLEHCRAAVHRKTYIYQPCPECGQADQPFDPDDSSKACVECRERAVFDPKQE
jgi:hypothetical protein